MTFDFYFCILMLALVFSIISHTICVCILVKELIDTW